MVDGPFIWGHGDLGCGARGVRYPGSGCSWRQTQGGGGCEQVPSAGPTALLHRNVWWDLGGWLRGPQPWARRRPRRTLGVPTSTLLSSGWVVRDPWGTSSLLCTCRRPPRGGRGWPGDAGCFPVPTWLVGGVDGQPLWPLHTACFHGHRPPAWKASPPEATHSSGGDGCCRCQGRWQS